MRVRYIKRVSYVISGWIGVSIPAMRVRYIAKVTSNSKAVSSFNSRYAGKIHQSMYPKGALCYTVSIPAMRVRYIFNFVEDSFYVFKFQFPLCG